MPLKTIGFERVVMAIYLEVRAGDASGDLFKKWLLDANKLRRLDHVQDLLYLSEEHHLEVQPSISFHRNNKPWEIMEQQLV